MSRSGSSTDEPGAAGAELALVLRINDAGVALMPCCVKPKHRPVRLQYVKPYKVSF